MSANVGLRYEFVTTPTEATVGTNKLMIAFDKVSGKILWQHDLQKEFNSPPLLIRPVVKVGFGCSLIAYRETIICSVGGPGQSVMAFRQIAMIVALLTVMAVRELSPARVVVAVPVASEEACRHLEPFADEVISARVPRNMMAVGMWYLDFAPTTDDEVQALLQSGARAGAAGYAAFVSSCQHENSRALWKK